MATIEKEKALDVVRQMVTDRQVSQEVAEKYFPELKESEESEDERIRKDIVFYIAANHKDDGEKARWLAWLEKQGAQPKEATYTHEVETGNGNIKALVTEKVQLPKFKVKYAGSEYTVLEVKENADVAFCGIEDEPNHIDYVLPDNCEIVSEQKLADKVEPKFKVGNKIKLAKEPEYPAREIIAIRNDAYYFDERVYLPFSRQDEWELVGQKPAFEMKTPEESLGIDSDTYSKIVDECVYGEQKPAWSEEDEKVTKWVIDYIGNCPNESFDFYGGVGKEAVLSWLNKLKDIKLKDILQLQPKQEWSEEDEENLKWFEKFFRAESVIAEGMDIPQDRYLWFKNLKGRVQLQNTWKPSDGQLECLGYAIGKAKKDWSPLTNNRIYLTLKALKEQLKKLRDE